MKDLSSMLNLETGLTAGESMSGGNTISPNLGKDAMTAPGSMPVNTPSKTPKINDTPAVQVTPKSDTSTGEKSSSSPTSTNGDWKKV